MTRRDLCLLAAIFLCFSACSPKAPPPETPPSQNSIKFPPRNDDEIIDRETPTLEIATSTAAPPPEISRIVFDGGATSALVQGTLPEAGKHSYVLWITKGQQCTLRLSGGGQPIQGAILAMRGNDGDVLLHESANATTWDGMIPRGQDYTIDIVGLKSDPLDYTLEVIIPPLEQELNAEKIKNAQLHTERGTVQLSDGAYEHTEIIEGNAETIWSIEISERYPIIFTDLDADGIDEALAFTVEWGGGTGHFIALAVFANQDGEAVNVATEYLGDRIIVNATDVQDDEIQLSLTLHGPDDPLCCPSMEVTQSYRYSENSLVLLP